MAHDLLNAAKLSRLALSFGCIGALTALAYVGQQAVMMATSRSLVSNEANIAEWQLDACSARNAKGIGLLGEYYSEPNFHGNVLDRTDATLEVDLVADWPGGTPSKSGASVRWRGWVKAPISGDYRFHSGIAEAVIAISQTLVKEDVAVTLMAGRFYPIRVELPNTLSLQKRQISLEWTAPHGMRFPISQALLFLPSEAAK